MERKFSEGDIVTLKSGGPEMTVNGYAWQGNYQTYDTVICFWFDGAEQKTAEFNQETLKLNDGT